jgi:Fe-Mn family superoxide dismutase
MAPNAGGEPTGDLATAIAGTFGNFDGLKAKVKEAGIGRFGSGWAWLLVTPDKKLAVENTLNQDSPLMHGKTRSSG